MSLTHTKKTLRAHNMDEQFDFDLTDIARDIAETTTKPASSAPTLETITPELAAHYLTLNTTNRPFGAKNVKVLVDIIKRGLWEVNGDTIRFDTAGKLLDGQHRLRAIVVAGIPVNSWVLRGLSPKVFTTIDTGKRRTGGDALAIMGVPNYNSVSAALRIVRQSNDLSPSWDGVLNKDINWTIMDVRLAYENHPGMVAAGHAIRTSKRTLVSAWLTASVAMFAYYWLASIDKADADRFFEWLETGINLGDGNPVAALRYKFERQKIADKGRSIQLRRANLANLFLTWNSLRDGKKRTRAAWAESHKFPIPH